MTTHCGFIAIIGRPNVGKSTLLNQLIGQKISITADKPQTTRHRILGVKTEGERQMVFIDTPGIHASRKKMLNRQLNREARSAMQGVDAVLFVVEALQWRDEDDLVVRDLQNLDCPIYCAVNKVDLVKEKERLLPFLETLSKRLSFKSIIPISATKKTQLKILENELMSCLPESPHHFPEAQITDKPHSFRMAEIIREKLTRRLDRELPYALTVEIEKVEREESRYLVHAIIWVEKESQKKIVIGHQGEQLKEVGTQARLDMKKMLKTAVHLELWVKVREGWSNNERVLKNLGYSFDD